MYGIPQKRRFNGKTYCKGKTFEFKKDAKKSAEKHRRKGRKTRLVPVHIKISGRKPYEQNWINAVLYHYPCRRK